MKALGNSKQKRLTIRQREAVDKIYRSSYRKDVMNAEKNAQFFMTIAMLKTLEDCYGFGEKRRCDFMLNFAKKANEIGDYLLSNKCIEGNSEVEVYDRDYNLSALQHYADYYGIAFNEEWCDYYTM